MRHETAAVLNELNRRFYAEQAASFSSTRRGSWAGWNRALEVAGFKHAPSTVVDVACGNMRFESYLAERFPGEPFCVIGVDNCPELVVAEGRACDVVGDSNYGESQVRVGAPLVAPARFQGASDEGSLQVRVGAEPAPSVRLQYVAADEAFQDSAIPSENREPELKAVTRNVSVNAIQSEAALAAKSKNLVGEDAGSQVFAAYLNRDLVDLLLANRPMGLPNGDLVVCFGFMHHVPGVANRRRMLAELLSSVAPGGTLVVSFWQFMTASGIAAQARELTEPALATLGLAFEDVEPGDYILGWQNSPTARRYCHNFTLDEVRSLVQDALEDAGLADEFTLAFFEADGRNSRLNCYLVAKRR